MRNSSVFFNYVCNGRPQAYFYPIFFKKLGKHEFCSFNVVYHMSLVLSPAHPRTGSYRKRIHYFKRITANHKLSVTRKHTVKYGTAHSCGRYSSKKTVSLGKYHACTGSCGGECRRYSAKSTTGNYYISGCHNRNATLKIYSIHIIFPCFKRHLYLSHSTKR